MEKKRILIVSRSFYPENSPRSFRTTELVKEFARQGHDVTLLTIKNDVYHIPFEREHGVTIKDLGCLQLPDIELNGSGGAARLVKRVLRRGLRQFLEYPDIELLPKVKKALDNESGYDLMISIAFPFTVHWGVAAARSANHRIAETWVADCGDPYMGLTLDTFNKLFYFKYFEKQFCRKADYISIPIEGAKAGYYPEFHEKIRVIPQGFNFDEVAIDHTTYRKHPIPTFAYAGGLIPGGRDPRALLEYLVNLKRDFKFILYTKATHLVEPWMEKGQGRIEIRNYIPRKELLKVLSGMDFLVNIENSTPLQAPTKLIDYYLAGRPVLSVQSSNIDENTIDEFLKGDYRGQLNFKDMDRYQITNVCRKFLDLCPQKICQ